MRLGTLVSSARRVAFREKRPDGCPFKICEFIPPDSKLQFESLDHANPDDFNTELAFPAPANRTDRARCDSDSIDTKQTIHVSFYSVYNALLDPGPQNSCDVHLVGRAESWLFLYWRLWKDNW